MRHTLPVAIAILLLTAGCGGSDDPQGPPSRSATTPAPTSAPTKASHVSNLIDYGDGGIVIAHSGDDKQLIGAPADFTAFMVAELAHQRAAKDDVCTDEPEIRVERIDVRGWAAGGVSIPQCGGSAALWARTGEGWQTVWNEQTLPTCSVLEKYDFPSSIAGTECDTPDGTTRSYPS
jgi:hypothetical protein